MWLPTVQLMWDEWDDARSGGAGANKLHLFVQVCSRGVGRDARAGWPVGLMPLCYGPAVARAS